MFDPKKLLDDLLGSQIPGTSGTVQVTNAAYNGSLGAGVTTSFGLQGGGSGTPVTATCAAS